MINKIYQKIKLSFQNLDKKILKILKNGLKFSFLISIVSIAILLTYLFFIHSALIYQIGLLTFEISLYFAIDFVVSALTIDTIAKQNL